jgi:hypothetical protein
MAYRIVAERRDETVRMDRSSMLVAVAKARVWASEGWKVTIIVGDENDHQWPCDARHHRRDLGIRDLT